LTDNFTNIFFVESRLFTFKITHKPSKMCQVVSELDFTPCSAKKKHYMYGGS